MGSFSWLKADTLTQTANIAYLEPFKCLIPKEFGGGFVKDRYQNYGYLGVKPDGSPKYDMFELLAFWNADVIYHGRPVKASLKYSGEFPLMKECDEFTNDNRSIGINLQHQQFDCLKYPLKLVSASYKDTYESCLGVSVNDPFQGFSKLPRTKLKVEYRRTSPYSEKDACRIAYWNGQDKEQARSTM